MAISNKQIAWSIFLAGFAALGIWGYAKVRKLLAGYDKTHFLYENMSLNYIAFLQNQKNLNGSFDFIIENPGDLKMKMKSLKMWVYIGGQKAAYIQNLTPVLIKPGEKTVQRLSFDTPTNLIKPLLGVFANNITNVKNIKVEYKGNIKIEAKVFGQTVTLPLPFTDSYTLGELM